MDKARGRRLCAARIEAGFKTAREELRRIQGEAIEQQRHYLERVFTRIAIGREAIAYHLRGLEEPLLVRRWQRHGPQVVPYALEFLGDE